MKTFAIDELEKIEEVLQACKVCYVGVAEEDGTPYVLPMNFGYADGIIYLHSAQEGRSIRAMEKNPKICVTFCTDPQLIRQHPDVACSYRMRAASVICEGVVEFEEDFAQKEEALRIIMKQYIDKHFEFSVPAVNNVKIWKLPLQTVSAKEFGTMKPGIVSYKNRTDF